MKLSEMKEIVRRGEVFHIGSHFYNSEIVCKVLDAMAMKAKMIEMGMEVPDPISSLLTEILMAEIGVSDDVE